MRRLEHISDTIAEDNPLAADRVLERIVSAAETLMVHPAIGRPGRIVGARELVLADTPYIIAYRVSAGEIIILTVIHAAQRWPDNL